MRCRHRGWSGLLLVLLGGCTAEPDGTLDGVVQSLASGQIYGNALPAKTVVLTYDDGPDEHTLPLARFLHDSGVRATFFVNGSRFCKTFGLGGQCLTPQETRPCNDGRPQAPVASPRYYPESLLDELVALGHRIANHSQDHCYLTGQTNVADLIWELQATQEILDRHICDGVRLFRAPYGQWNRGVLDRLSSVMGLPDLVGPINWDVDGGDWDCWQKGRTPEACADGYLEVLNDRSRQNGIFLMHDRPEFNVTYEGPLLMARVLVPRLKAAGFSFATMDEVLKLTPGPATPACPGTPLTDAGPTEVATTDGGADGDGPPPIAAPPDTGAAAAVGTDGASGTGGAAGTGGASGEAPRARSGGAGGGGQVPGQALGETSSSGGCTLAGPTVASQPCGGLLAIILGLLGRWAHRRVTGRRNLRFTLRRNGVSVPRTSHAGD